jgi:hypothetical protein
MKRSPLRNGLSRDAFQPVDHEPSSQTDRVVPRRMVIAVNDDGNIVPYADSPKMLRISPEALHQRK